MQWLAVLTCFQAAQRLVSMFALQGRLGDLFDPQQLLTDVSGSGNNWAHGHHLYGPQYRDNLLESIRRPVEACESLQSFLLLQSLGGGTGSGLGCYILNLLEVAALNACLSCVTIAPASLATWSVIMNSLGILNIACCKICTLQHATACIIQKAFLLNPDALHEA